MIDTRTDIPLTELEANVIYWQREADELYFFGTPDGVHRLGGLYKIKPPINFKATFDRGLTALNNSLHLIQTQGWDAFQQLEDTGWQDFDKLHFKLPATIQYPIKLCTNEILNIFNSMSDNRRELSSPLNVRDGNQ